MFDQNVVVEWAKSHNVEATARSYCLSCVNNYLAESPEDEKLYFGEYYPEKLMLELEKVYCIINWNEPEYSHIIALVPIIYDGKEIGRYELFYRMSGEIYDDLLVIDGQEQLVY
ncbi:hypothetical protein AB4Z30_17635 [Paenibacillus sp. 2TAF8]|jgi:hypothetical protein|uniref:hypothetical protein n=1 Tax=Paenibacillus sp. 2TAF8 TaxID=3233020 RepID=UPI003F9E4E78